MNKKVSTSLFVLFFFAVVGNGQTIENSQFHLTKSNLLEFKKLNIIEDRSVIKQEKFINFNPAILFNGDNDYFEIFKGLGDLSQATIFTVYQSDDAAKEQDLWRIYGEESNITLTTSHAENADQIADYEGGITEFPVLNTYLIGYTPKNSNSFSIEPRIQVGSFIEDKQKLFKGAIAEIIVFNKVLRGKKLQILQSFLAIKYGIALNNGQDYTSSFKKKIYNIKENEGFTFRIAGLGRDDKNNLYQKQSHSTQDSSIVTIGVDEIANANNDNKSKITNHTFLVWGDNNQELTIETNERSNSQVPLMKRKWKIQVTGETVSGLNTTIEFEDLEQTEKYGDDYLLVIDNSADGTFSPENTRYIKASEVENNIISFSDVQWDLDKSGSDIFTIGRNTELAVTLNEEKPISCEKVNNGVLSYEVSGGIEPYTFELINSNLKMRQWYSINNSFQDNRIENLEESEYTLKVTDALGTQQEAIYSLTSPNPISVNLGEDKTFHFGRQEVILDATILSEDEISYQWSSESGFTAETPTVKVSKPGVYSVIATSSNGCKAADTIRVEGNFIESFLVFPNHSPDGNYKVQVELRDRRDITIYLFDISGRLIYSKKGKGRVSYSLAGKPIAQSGIYTVILQIENQSLKTSRILIVE